MKCLFISARRYSISNSVVRGFIGNGWEVKVCDYEEFFPAGLNRFVSRMNFLPNTIRSLWMKPYLSRINGNYLREFLGFRPDLVLIYNNQHIDPEILEQMKKSARIAFFLGDNPLYSPTSLYNIHILKYADYIICPDSMWKEQLERMGINNIRHDFLGFDEQVYYPSEPSEEQLSRYKSDFVYIGHAHRSGWGYKRFLFLNHFSGFNIRIFLAGTGYKDYWIDFFPDLKDKIVIPEGKDTYNQDFSNLIYNCSKIGPVELVPSYFRGIHPRVFDLLGSGIFPLCEYSGDLQMLFGDLNVPFIKNYNEIREISEYILHHDNERKELVGRMRQRVVDKYHPSKVVGRLLSELFSR